MAWRLHEHVVRGEIDNRVRGRVTGCVWLAGIAEPLTVDLEGDCEPDLAGAFLSFKNPEPVAMKTAPPALLQRGVAGNITAARKVRVFDVPLEEAIAMQRRGSTPPEHLANALYLEWYSKLSGRVVIESSDYALEISEPSWRFTEKELAERAQRAAEAGKPPFAIQMEGEDEAWDEFRCEQFLRESDNRTEKFGELLEKYQDHPERDRIIAREMDWPWIEEALDEKEKTTEPEPEEMSDALNPEPDFDLDPAREGIDWVLDGRGHPVHPTAKRAHEALHRLLDELRAAGLFPESRDEPLENFVGLFMTLSAKLAGAFSSIVHSHGSPDAGLSIAFLKRALKVLNETIAAADAERLRESLSFERVAHYRDELFKVREEILAVIARLRA